MAKDIKERLSRVPRSPGVYLHKDKSGRIIYIGKALNLRSRISSYFHAGTSNYGKTLELVNLIHDFEYILTDSEQEALLLENNLIKRHQPQYNVRLKDGKSYPYIKIDLQEDFPRVYVARQQAVDADSKALFFGPYASAGSVHRTMRLVKRLHPFRSCTKTITGKDARPCLEYYIKRCVAPCTGYASREQYHAVIQDVISFLENGPAKSIPILKKQMREASDATDYERAAVLRNRIRDFEAVIERQKVMGLGNRDMDAIAVALGSKSAWVEVFFVRNGGILDRAQFTMENTAGVDEGRVLAAFIGQFYAAKRSSAALVICSAAVNNHAVLAEWLSSKSGKKVRIEAPQRGMKHQLLKMVMRNAAHARDQGELKNMRPANDSARALAELKDALQLPDLPLRIECYDISHVQGTQVVASMAVLDNGAPGRSQYRKFRIKNKHSNDDFASMTEVLGRRLKRLKQQGDDGDSFGKRPDLIVIDGGKGQLSAALEAVLNSGVDGLQLAALAKREELVYLPNSADPVALPRDSRALHLLQVVRDEAHRFAVSFHRQSRSKAAVRSRLESVPGIGPTRKRQLVRRFGSVQGIRDASLEELCAVPGISRKLATLLRELA